MALKLSAIPTFNTNGREWVEINLSDSESFKLLVGSTYTSEFRSAQSAISRQVNTVSFNDSIGGKDFSIDKSANSGLIESDLYAELISKYLVFDWDGIVDENNQPVPFSTEKCYELLKAYPETFTPVLAAGNKIARNKADEVADTVEK